MAGARLCVVGGLYRCRFQPESVSLVRVPALAVSTMRRPADPRDSKNQESGNSRLIAEACLSERTGNGCRGVGSWRRGLVGCWNGCRAAALIEEERVEGNEWMVDDKPAPNRRDGRSKRERCARRALQLDRGEKGGRRAVVVCGRLFAWQGACTQVYHARAVAPAPNPSS